VAGKTSYKTEHADPVVRSLEKVRRKLGYSQKKMAGALGVPFRTYQKWLYTDQKPRHVEALLSRAGHMCIRTRANCWEVLKCGREQGGEKASRLGPCPAAIDVSAEGVNTGRNGGRVCWAISGTFCGVENEHSAERKILSCLSCDFFNRVLQEEGLANFKLLKPGQSYTQA